MGETVSEHAGVRGVELSRRLMEAVAGLVAAVASVGQQEWHLIPGPDVWSIGKDVEHVADAIAYHQWIIRRTIGEPVPTRYPALERRQMTSDLLPDEAVAIIRRRAEDTARLIVALTDVQLDLPTKPPRAGGEVLADTIDRVLVGHFDVHRVAIEEKLLTLNRIGPG